MTTTAACPSTLVIERVFPHPPQKLWRALTESSLLAQWMMNNDFEPAVGRKFQFRADPMPNWNGIVDCEVLVVDPQKCLSYSWGVGDPAGGLQWKVLWTLTPAEGGTHVRMEQSGFRPDQQAAYHGANYGWQKFIGNLESVLGRRELNMKTKSIVYWTMTILVAFFIGGGGVSQVMQYLGNRNGVVPVLGYPMYFFAILGVWKALGAIAILWPRFPLLKEWAYAGIFFDLTGAAASCAAVGGYGAYGFHVLAPLIITGFTVTSWALRPPSRKIGVFIPASEKRQAA